MPVIKRLIKALTALQLKYLNKQTFINALESTKYSSVTALINLSINYIYTKLRKYYNLIDYLVYYTVSCILYLIVK
jgi:predicted KAP-like P-loop ATPase